MTQRNYHGYAIGRCVFCGKFIYQTRMDAKQAAKRIHPGDKFNAYECREALDLNIPDQWHYGHMSRAVIEGKERRGDRYRDQ